MCIRDSLCSPSCLLSFFLILFLYRCIYMYIYPLPSSLFFLSSLLSLLPLLSFPLLPPLLLSFSLSSFLFSPLPLYSLLLSFLVLSLSPTPYFSLVFPLLPLLHHSCLFLWGLCNALSYPVSSSAPAICIVYILEIYLIPTWLSSHTINVYLLSCNTYFCPHVFLFSTDWINLATFHRCREFPYIRSTQSRSVLTSNIVSSRSIKNGVADVRIWHVDPSFTMLSCFYRVGSVILWTCTCLPHILRTNPHGPPVRGPRPPNILFSSHHIGNFFFR